MSGCPTYPPRVISSSILLDMMHTVGQEKWSVESETNCSLTKVVTFVVSELTFPSTQQVDRKSV